MQGVPRRDVLGRICQCLQRLPAGELRHHGAVFLPRLHTRPLLLDSRIRLPAVLGGGFLARRRW